LLLISYSHSFVVDGVHLQLRSQHRKSGASQELSKDKTQLGPTITYSRGKRKIQFYSILFHFHSVTGKDFHIYPSTVGVVVLLRNRGASFTKLKMTADFEVMHVNFNPL